MYYTELFKGFLENKRNKEKLREKIIILRNRQEQLEKEILELVRNFKFKRINKII